MWEHPTASGCDWRRRTRKKDEEHTALERYTTHDHTRRFTFTSVHTVGEAPSNVCHLSLYFKRSHKAVL